MIYDNVETNNLAHFTAYQKMLLLTVFTGHFVLFNLIEKKIKMKEYFFTVNLTSTG